MSDATDSGATMPAAAASSAADPDAARALTRALIRTTLGNRLAPGGLRPPAPVRIVHLGLGAFHRAHQAWYTAHSTDAAQWGIAAFTGHSTELAETLTAQNGLYTLIERGADSDRFEIVDSIVEAHPGGDLAAFVALLSSPDVAVLTLTITERAYHLRADARLDLTHADVQHDIAELARVFAAPPAPAPLPLAPPIDLPKEPPKNAGKGLFRHMDAPNAETELRTALGRVLLGLEARRRAGGGPLAIVPCDNIPGNGRVVRDALDDLAAAVATSSAATTSPAPATSPAAVSAPTADPSLREWSAAVSAPTADPSLREWLRASTSFVSTSVDRITPRAAPADRADVTRATGWIDDAPVVTEPFSDWVLSGDFPSGRPAWHTAGARFVDDIEPWEARKLWMLNGAHTLLAAAGRLRGHATVAQAVLDPVCRDAVEALWNEDARHLPAALDLDDYRAALLSRFENPRIEHQLAQIGQDAQTKVRLRIVPVAALERADGCSAEACASAIGAWLAWARHSGEVGAEAARQAAGEAPREAAREAVRALDPTLGSDAEFVERVEAGIHFWQQAQQAERQTRQQTQQQTQENP